MRNPPPTDFTAEQLERLQAEMPVTANLLTWTAIHGNLCLALRHPSNQGASREMIMQFVVQLGDHLVQEGVVTCEQVDYDRHQSFPGWRPRGG